MEKEKVKIISITITFILVLAVGLAFTFIGNKNVSQNNSIQKSQVTVQTKAVSNSKNKAYKK